MATVIVNDWTPEEKADELSLDASYEKIQPGGFVIVQKPGQDIRESSAFGVLDVEFVPRTAYGISAKTTRLRLDGDWFDAGTGITMETIRKTAVLAQSEELELSERPVLNESEGTLEDIFGSSIELDGLYDGIQTGRWIIVSGERTDVGTTGVMASELAMVAGVQHYVDQELPGDTAHTTLRLANPLAYSYRRDSVTINANVVKATHGETRAEVLGSGDAARSLQGFALKQSPLTHVSAATVSGTSSTLKVRVNDILWRESDTLEGLTRTDRAYVTATDDEGKTKVTFGNGQKGSRLPTGAENVKAVYRTGIGSTGNVKAGQISLLATKPLGVKGVINPIRASGGADRENRDQARINAPLVTTALDRLVSVKDYADYARTFAGIGKADARMVTDGSRGMVHLTIAGAGDIPIDETSDLYRNLETALRAYGDPNQPVTVAVRERIAILISARVKLLPEYSWDTTEPRIRAALLDTFSFDRRELGQSVYKSEVIGAIMGVRGVEYLEIEAFKGLTQSQLLEMLKALDRSSSGSGTDTDATGTGKVVIGPERPDRPKTPLPIKVTRVPRCSVIGVSLARFDRDDPHYVKAILPAQLAYLQPDVPDTLVLNEVKE